jgi:uncharacterized membrane protein
MNRYTALSILIILASLAMGLYFYPFLPEKVASHWNINNEVDGYLSRFWGIVIMPLISSVCLLLFRILPKIDPKKEHNPKIQSLYDSFGLMLILFLAYIYFLTLAWNLGVKFTLIRFLAPALGLLYFYLGTILTKVKSNFFFGIRTPWTLSNDRVWDKTHLLGSELFKISGILAIFAPIFPNLAIWFVFFPIIIFALFLTFYSYLLFRQQKSS